VKVQIHPQNINYPTDAKLLNSSREASEAIIDELYEQGRDLWSVKPRTYRRKARDKWLDFSKSRKKSGTKKIRKQLKAQLSYMKRNLGHIEDMFEGLLAVGRKIELSNQNRKKLYVISEIYRQQKEMYESNRRSIESRIVSLSQPWVRPIVRGKAGKAVEFGAKINISLSEQMVIIDRASFDNFNEGVDLIEQLKSYKARYGYYPEYALADKIYLTRENRKFMKSNNIKHTGPPLGRPREVNKTDKAKNRKKNNERNHVEAKIGQGKLKYGWDLVRTKTMDTSLCSIHMIALAMNMATLLKKSFLLIWRWVSFIIVQHNSCLIRI